MTSIQTDYFRQIGIELTFVTKKFNKPMNDEVWNDGWDSYCKKYKDQCKNENMDETWRITIDAGCVEHPSPILKSWKESQQWYEKALSIGSKVGLTPYHELQEGGMGHIHMAMTTQEALIMVADMMSRPYLTWILATPNGSHFCQSFLHYYTRADGFWGDAIRPLNLKKIGTNSTFSRTIAGFPQSRFVLANYNDSFGTLEFRAFDAADSWEMQEEHIAFYQRYVHKILSNSDRHFPVPYNSKKGIQHLKSMLDGYRDDKDRCIRDFKHLIVDTLELPWDRYSGYVDQNLHSAFEFGLRY